MSGIKKIRFAALDLNDAEQVIKTIELLATCFADRERYTIKRLSDELKEAVSPFYRQFIVAVVEGVVVGVGGVKAVDWASNTHVLYLSAVHPSYRSRGIGKALIKARLKWLKESIGSGRVLVSTAKIDRFKLFGFKPVTHAGQDGRAIMLKEF